LMILCESDLTSKNPAKVQRYLHNFATVRQKLRDIEEKDRIRNFQPPVDGNEIMDLYDLEPCSAVGQIKEAIKEAILDGVIHNDRREALDYMEKWAREELHLTPAKPLPDA
jgi:poly(A) polymerase